MSEADENAAPVWATATAFAVLGLVNASWAARIPQVKSQLGLDTSQLGLVLLAVAVGSLVALPRAGSLVVWLGSHGALRAASLLSAVGIVVVAFGARGQIAATVAGLFVVGIASGVWDVSINVQGTVVEQRLRRSLMPRFHAWYSIGTVVGAAVSVAIVAADVSVTAHLVGVACIVPPALWLASGRFLPNAAPRPPDEHRTARSHSAWRERRTLLIGVIVLAFALTDGSGNNWISVSMIQGRHLAPVLGTAAYGLFLTAMTVSRWNGPHALERLGRVRTLRLLVVIAIGGLLVFALIPWTPLAFVGVALWGVGSSLGFPVGMSAGADQPKLAAPRVGVIASIGYLAFLGGPPVIGLVASWVGLPRAVLIVIVPLVPAALVAGFAAPLGRTQKDGTTASPPVLS